MAEWPYKMVDESQRICISCGFCCDGTLFNNASLKANEKGNLPPEIEKLYLQKNGKEFFSLPCPYFRSKCSIYYKKKPYVCSAYRCKLLKEVADNKISYYDAINIVKNAKEMRNAIMEYYSDLVDDRNILNFRELLKRVGAILKEDEREAVIDESHDKFIGRCNIFEALLTKHFRSEKDFENMIADE